ncbi:MAG TPA: hypothetical protein PK447_03165 [Ignavibacteria bacterium]|nr:hypothetical protein [Ignavibacteria bacterium]
MAKVQSFADKAAKLARKAENTAIDPETGKETKLVYIRMVESVKTESGSYKFLSKNMRVYESSYKQYKP